MDNLSPLEEEEVTMARLINDYAHCRVVKSWMGSRNPDEHPRIRRKLKRARERLEQHILQEFGVEVKLE